MTAVIEGVLGAVALYVPTPDPSRGRVLVACAEGEHHTMPARMGAELLRGDGWEVTFLGGSLPADDLQGYAAVTAPDVVVISCTVPLFLPGARRCFAAIAELGLRAIAAGAAFGHTDLRARRLGATGWLDSTASLKMTLSHLHASPVPAPSPPEAFPMALAAEELLQRCRSLAGERLPRQVTGSPEQLATFHSDIADALDYLTTAIDIGDDTVFDDFVERLTNLVRVRGQDSATLGELLGIVGDAVASSDMTEAVRLCATHRPADTAT